MCRYQGYGVRHIEAVACRAGGVHGRVKARVHSPGNEFRSTRQLTLYTVHEWAAPSLRGGSREKRPISGCQVPSTCSARTSVTSVSHLKTDRQSLEPRNLPDLAFRFCRNGRSISLLSHRQLAAGQ